MYTVTEKVRHHVWSADSISAWQHTKLCQQVRPRDTFHMMVGHLATKKQQQLPSTAVHRFLCTTHMTESSHDASYCSLFLFLFTSFFFLLLPFSFFFSLLLHACVRVCVCVCVFAKDRNKERERENEMEGRGRKTVVYKGDNCFRVCTNN